MANCNSNSLSFSPLSGRKVLADFSGGSITSDAGCILLREADKQLGLIDSVAAVMTDNRNPAYIKHKFDSLLRQRVYSLACGYDDLNDHSDLRHDDAFQTAVGELEALASTSTLCRLDNRAPHQDVVALHRVFLDQFVAKHKKNPPAEFVLDFDATDAILYGDQEHRHYNGYYGDHCYMPLYVFCGDDLLVAYLRPSNIDGAKHAWAILKLLNQALKAHFPNAKIHFRGDCGFARPKMINWCEKHDIDYTVGLPSNPKLQSYVESMEEILEVDYQVNGENLVEHIEFDYAAKSWPRKRRVIAKCRINHHGLSRRFVMTDTDTEKEAVYDNRYCARGDMENKIKQQKLDLGASRMSCQVFQANQMRMLFSALAYLLLQKIQESSTSKVIQKAYAGTIRLKLIKIGAVIIKNTRRIQIKMSQHFPNKETFANIAAQLTPT